MFDGLHNDQEGCNSSFYTMENPTANMKFSKHYGKHFQGDPRGKNSMGDVSRGPKYVFCLVFCVTLSPVEAPWSPVKEPLSPM